jgi:ribosomal subunit interface protein
MKIPLQITFKDVDQSPAIETRIRERAERLERFHDRIMGCRVVVGTASRSGHKGHLYAISVDVTLPGGEVAATRERAMHHAHEDVYVAIRDAFDAVERRLEDHARRGRGQVKQHPEPTHGKVVRLFADEGYGFIETSAGEEVYFHRNSVVGEHAFAKLKIGSEVRLSVAEGESAKGAQASTVELIGKHHLVG